MFITIFILIINMGSSVNTNLQFDTKENCEKAKTELYKDTHLRSSCVEMNVKKKTYRCKNGIERVGNGAGLSYPAIKEMLCEEE